MANIAEKLEGVIEKLDNMTTEVVPKIYGTDIASKIEHIAKQLDYVQAGGSGGGDGGTDIMTIHVTADDDGRTADKSYDEIMTHVTNGGLARIIDYMDFQYFFTGFDIPKRSIVFSGSYCLISQTNAAYIRYYVIETDSTVKLYSGMIDTNLQEG